MFTFGAKKQHLQTVLTHFNHQWNQKMDIIQASTISWGLLNRDENTGAVKQVLFWNAFGLFASLKIITFLPERAKLRSLYNSVEEILSGKLLPLYKTWHLKVREAQKKSGIF